MHVVNQILNMNPWTLYAAVLSLYLFSIVLGGVLAKWGVSDTAKAGALSRRFEFLYYPVMPLRNRYRSLRNGVMLKKKFRLLALMIFLNNIFLALLYSRILLGIFPFLPLLLLFLSGLAQGTVIAKQPAAALSPVFLLEFGGYVFGSAAGTALSISLLHTIVLGTVHFGLFFSSVKALIPWAAAFLLAGAAVESLNISRMPIPEVTSEEDLKGRAGRFREGLGKKRTI